MKIRMDRKGAIIGDTITWFAAFIIIIFIAIVLITVANILSSARDVPAFGEGRDEIRLDESGTGNTDSQRILANYLASNVEYNGNDIKMKDLIVDALQGAEDTELNSFILEKSKEILDFNCEDYLLRIPNLGVIRANRFKYFEADYFNEVPSRTFDSAVKLKIPLESWVVEVAYRKLRKC